MGRWCILLLLAVSAVSGLAAQDNDASVSVSGERRNPERNSNDSPLQGFFPRFKGRALVLDINARIVEQNQTVIWNESHQQTTIPGRPVGVKLVGSNIVVAAQFTPYLNHRGLQKFLVAQGQIWMEVPGQGIRYHTSMQTIPLEFNEPIYFFPLGKTDENDAIIEVMLTLYPYEDENKNEDK